MPDPLTDRVPRVYVLYFRASPAAGWDRIASSPSRLGLLEARAQSGLRGAWLLLPEGQIPPATGRTGRPRRRK
jgi:hypothetical protein